MANLTCSTAKHATLTANTVDKVTMSGVSDDDVLVINRSSSGVIYVRVDGVNPTVAGDDCYAVPASTGLCIDVGGHTTKEVRLISSGALDYSVQGSTFAEAGH